MGPKQWDLAKVTLTRQTSHSPIMPPPTPPNAYVEFKAELEQILQHKWLVSEKENRDVGFERALNDWAQNHRAAWRKERNIKVTRRK